MDVGSVAADFVLIKATGGNGYVNPTCDLHVQQAITLDRKWGVYHYFSDGFNDGDPIAEANWFVDNCLGYVGRGMLILDWERGGNPDVGNVGKALAWLQHVESRTGVKPLIYMSLSLVQELDWSPVVAGNYGLWCAAYLENNTPIPNYQMDPNRDPNPHWDGNINDVIWQFTSTGRLDGYGGNLDCNFFYGTREAFDAYARTPAAPVPEPTTTTTTESVPPPTPEPTTTTTTVEPDPTPDPDPTTTTTTTQEPQPEPPDTTTTTTVVQDQPAPGQSFWVAFWSVFVAIYNWLFKE